MPLCRKSCDEFHSGLWLYYIDANHKAPAWTGVEYLYRFLTRTENSVGPTAEEVPLHKLQPGDLVQLSFDGKTFSHTPVVVYADHPRSTETVLLAAHSADSDNRPLSSYDYERLRCLHITAVKRKVPPIG